jgi:hypothetical protein
VDASGKVGSDVAHRGGQALVGWQGAVGAACVLVEGGSGGVAAASGGDPAARGGGKGDSCDAASEREEKRDTWRGTRRGSSSHLRGTGRAVRQRPGSGARVRIVAGGAGR